MLSVPVMPLEKPYQRNPTTAFALPSAQEDRGMVTVEMILGREMGVQMLRQVLERVVVVPQGCVDVVKSISEL